ncbi:hypothetical protein MUK42_02540 [Musa troglodytarum]|uniref:Uncharacterized protein n=1 Tax=Musa troglodytarum TaxID=320322 RepID=A0A9E7KQ50_9LILI|nr:hypothetical protein MUK42_02540 [Musa troglodytarum]
MGEFGRREREASPCSPHDLGISSGSSCPEISFAHQDIQRCPFLRNINEPTNFSFSSVNFPVPAFPWARWCCSTLCKFFVPGGKPEPKSVDPFNPLAAKAATISLSAFGPGGPFGFDFFSNKSNRQNNRSSQEGSDSAHESQSNGWLESGQCPIAKSYRAVSGVLPLVAKVLKPPAGVKLRCPPIVVAARAALAQTAFVKNLRPQPLPAKMLTIAILGMAANVPLGVWREHTKKFSPPVVCCSSGRRTFHRDA